MILFVTIFKMIHAVSNYTFVCFEAKPRKQGKYSADLFAIDIMFGCSNESIRDLKNDVE